MCASWTPVGDCLGFGNTVYCHHYQGPVREPLPWPTAGKGGLTSWRRARKELSPLLKDF